jgi:flagellar hook-associated protein 1 FlgK
MASNILSIGKSALDAAQVGISTTGHNIANASTAGYSRQVVMQSAATAQNFGYGYLGQGTNVTAITRIYSDILAKQAVSSQSTSASVEAYKTQITPIDNMLSDATAGLTPAMSNFFNSVQDLASNPSNTATRQSMLSNAQSLVNRFQNTASSLNEIGNNINTQLTSSVSIVNSYAKQIAGLNNAITNALSLSNNVPNDLMDQRDQLVLNLSKQIKTTIVDQGQGAYNIFVGNGLPLVVGTDTNALTTINSASDTSRLEVAFQSNSKITELGLNNLPGGIIGGLLQFRSESLDSTKNQLGQIAVVLGETFNTQLKQGVDLNGNNGTNLFTIAAPIISTNTQNTGIAKLSSQIVDAQAITTSDYRLQYDGNNYNITRLSDNTLQSFSSLPQTLDGLSFSLTGAMHSGDSFVVRPTQNAASTLSIAITDVKSLAIGSPTLSYLANVTNTGTGGISGLTSSVNSASPAVSPFTITYNSPAGSITVLPNSAITVTTANGSITKYAAGSPAIIPTGATVSLSGASFTITGLPANSDQFVITRSSNINTPSDNSNGLLLAKLQMQGTVNNSTNSYTDAFTQLVSSVGNKTREINVSAEAESKILDQATAAMQSESGVNLDEEATNLMRYQQAYQAAGKMMQIASQLFDTLLQLGK